MRKLHQRRLNIRTLRRKLLSPERLEARQLFAIDLGSTPYLQNFDSLANSGNSNSILPTGWALFETGSNANTTYRANDGLSTTGDTYSFGTTNSTDRALGTLQSGSLIPIIGAEFRNSTSNVFTTLALEYVGEQWRIGAANRPDSLIFEWSTDATSLNDSSGTWNRIESLEMKSFQGAVGAVNGNNSAFRRLLSANIPANLAPSASLWIRWTDFNATGADDGMGIDDFKIQGFATPSLSISSDAGSSAILEGTGSTTSVTYTITRTGPLNDEVAVDWSLLGTGIYPSNGDDFIGPTSGSLVFASNETVKTLTVLVNGDNTVEPDEEFTVSLSNARNISTPSSGASVGNATATSLILSDDLQNLQAGDVIITGINATNPDQFSFVTLVDLVGNMPIKFTDNGWDANASPPGLWRAEGTVMYVTPAEGLAAGTKVIIEVLGSSTVMRTGPGTSSVSGSFGLNTTGESLFAYIGTEDAPRLLFGINTNYRYISSGDSMSNSLTFLPPSLTLGGTILDVLGDSDQQLSVANAQFNHTITVGSRSELQTAVATRANWEVSSSAFPLNTSNFTISDKNQIAIDASPRAFLEGTGSDTTFTFTVTRTGDGLSAQSVDFSITGTGTNPANASDFLGDVFPTGTVSFPADGTLSRTITIQVKGDTIVELDESFLVTLSNASSTALIGNSTATGIIQNDDYQNIAPGELIITGMNATNPDQFSFVPLVDLVENSQIHFTDNAWDGNRAIPGLTTNEGTITYTTPTGGISKGTKIIVQSLNSVASVLVGTGSASLNGNFALNASGENLIAYNGTTASPNLLFILNSNVSYLTSGSTSASTTYLPSALAIGSSAVAPLGLTAAVANAEYTHSTGTEGSSNYLRSLVANSAKWLASSSAISLNSNNFSVGGPGTLSIAATDAVKLEGNSGTTAFTFTVNRTGSVVGPATATYTVSGGSNFPANADDFQSMTGTVEFTNGETSKLISILVNGDTAVESDESFVVTISDPINAVIGPASFANGLILNDDSTLVTPTVTITSPNSVTYSRAEYAATATVSGDTDPASRLTFTYYLGSGASGQGSASPPVNAGTYSVIAAYSGNPELNLGPSQSDIFNFSITHKILTATATAQNKPYDGSTNAVVQLQLDGVIAGDSVTVDNAIGSFENRQTGLNKAVTVTSATLAGSSASNYRLSGSSWTTSADITANVMSTTVNGGTWTGALTVFQTAQRSQIVNIVLAFAQPILNLTPADLVLTNIDGFSTPTNVGNLIITRLSPSSFVITFGAGSSVITRASAGGGNSLADGNYRLNFADNSNSQFGAVAADRFFRLFGDNDGDGDVDGLDIVAQRRALSTYNAAFDWDGDGKVSTGVDLTNFLTNRNKRRRSL